MLECVRPCPHWVGIWTYYLICIESCSVSLYLKVAASNPLVHSRHLFVDSIGWACLAPRGKHHQNSNVVWLIWKSKCYSKPHEPTSSITSCNSGWVQYTRSRAIHKKWDPHVIEMGRIISAECTFWGKRKNKKDRCNHYIFSSKQSQFSSPLEFQHQAHHKTHSH